MKLTFVATTLLMFCHSSLSAAEIYFDTVSTAKASRLNGAYFGTFAGGVNVGNTVTTGRIKDVPVDGNKLGWIAGVEFGYKWVTPVGINLATELEFYYLNQDISGSRRGTKYRSDLAAFGAMANGIIQFDLETMLGPDAGWVGAIKPYVGAGVGFGYGYQNNIAYTQPGRSERTLNDGGESSFGYQLLAGIEVVLAENFSVYGEYRYLDLYDFGNGGIGGAEFSALVLGARFQY
jgi:opacity protein-like surface antigen